MRDAFIAAEIQRQLEESLARFGIAGQVQVAAGLATLSGHGPTVQVEVDSLEMQWGTMTPETRTRRVGDVARRLAAERRSFSPGETGPSRVSVPDWLVALGAAILLAGAAFGAFVLYRQLRPAKDPTPPVVQDYEAYERERVARAARVCEATRSRILRGASVSPSEVEGWVVELWLLRSATGTGAPPAAAGQEAALSAFLGPASADSPEGRRIIWKEAPTLSALQGPDTVVSRLPGDLPGPDQPAWHGLRLVAGGRYVVPYFDEAGRLEHVKLARSLADAWKADHGALYARCTAGEDHHVGSWFRGPTAGAAAGALVFFMGAFGEQPGVRTSFLVPEGEATVRLDFAWDGLLRATAPLKKKRIMTLVGAEGGMIAGTDASTSTISFPFRDANRATRAAHSIARELGFGAMP